MLTTKNNISREEQMLLKFNQQTFSTYLLKVQLKNIVRKIFIQNKYYNQYELYKVNQLIQKKMIYYDYSRNMLTIHENFNKTLELGILTFPAYDKIDENYDFTRKINNLVKKNVQNRLKQFYQDTIKSGQRSNTLYDYLHHTNFNYKTYKNISAFLSKRNIKLKFSTLEKIQSNLEQYKNTINQNIFLSSDYMQKYLVKYDIFSFSENHDIAPVIKGIALNVVYKDPLKIALSTAEPTYRKNISNHIVDRNHKIVFISNQPQENDSLTKQELLNKYKKYYIKYLHDSNEHDLNEYDSNEYKMLYKSILTKIENGQYLTIELKENQHIDSYIYVDKKSVQ